MKIAPKHVLVLNISMQLGNTRYTSWLQPKKRSAGSMDPAEERARWVPCVWRSLGARLKKHRGIPQSRSQSWIWVSPNPVVEPKSTGGWGPKWANAEVFLDRPGNLPHQQKQQQQHRGLVPGFPNPLPLSEEERERGTPSKAEPRFRRFHFSYLCFFAFSCPVFEWWWGICNYRAQHEREGERERGEITNLAAEASISYL